MSSLRFQHVFVVLMGLGAASGFLIPPQFAGKLQPRVELLFAPVSRPVAGVARWMTGRFSSPAVADRRSVQDVQAENQQLWAELALYRTQLDEMLRRDAELSKLGSIKDLCRLVKVAGADSGVRESLALAGSSFEGIREDQYVLYPGGLVGRVRRAGAGGAQVQLITDRGFRIRVRFVRYTKVQGKTVLEPLGTPVVVAEGTGTESLVVRSLSLSQIGLDANGKPLRESHGERLIEGSDYAVLYDGDCPRQLQGETIGRVVRVGPRPDARLLAEIRIQPDTNLKRLREVMVMTKETKE